MQSRSQPVISPHRLARYLAWGVLWLIRYAWFLVQDGPDAQRHLDRMARFVANLVILRAAALMPEPPHRRARPLSAPPGFRKRDRVSSKRLHRAIIGSTLRRKLHARGAGVRLGALFAVLLDIDAWAVRIARPLTRLRPILLMRPPAQLFVSRAYALEPALADSS